MSKTKVTPKQRRRVIARGAGPSKAKQAFAKDCDINLIVKRHAERGMWDHLAPRTPLYGDFSKALELQDAIEAVRAAEADFMSLPAAVRAAVDNDPVQFLQAMADEGGFHHLVQNGLPVADTYRAPAATLQVPDAQGESSSTEEASA